jgi:hypothetical protein
MTNRLGTAMAKIFSSFIVGLFAFATTVPSYALTLSEWEQRDESWKQAYVFAIGEYLMTVVTDDTEYSKQLNDGYRRCFVENKFSSNSVVKLVGRHVLLNPETSTTPMLINTLQALSIACKQFLPYGNNAKQ